MAAHEESPKRMCKSTSMPSSPSHESHHGIEIEHDMEVPLTGIVNAGDKRKPYTPGSTKSRTSFGSTASNNKKKYKTRADIEHRPVGRGSPLTPNRDYMILPVHSSQRKLSKSHDVTLESEPMSLFRTSPLIKAKVPRSPKIHPSPKLKKSKTPKSTPNEEQVQDTKHDMLTKRLQKGISRGSERVVMGSDCTPTNSIKSPPSVSDSVKTECETPTNINLSKDVIHRKHNNNLELGIVNESSIKPVDIQLRDIDKHDVDDDRKPASGTSDESTSAEKEGLSQMTTSFIENSQSSASSKPRRPTSLTESYSKMSLASSLGKHSEDGSKNNSAEGIKDKMSIHSTDDRQNALPKPDGQSPKSPRVEVIKSVANSSKNSSPAKHSKNSTPKSVRSVKSDRTDGSCNKTKSPARSTPSDVAELEYDDFIDMDDTYSYFDPLETEKLTWHGVEKVPRKTPKQE